MRFPVLLVLALFSLPAPRAAPPLLLETPDTPAGGFCAPPALGAPCATGGLASIGNTEPVPGFSVGNPVHLATGNKYQLDVDLPPNASAPGLELVRHYNALATQAGALGRNWALSYDTRLQARGAEWWLLQADGSRRRVAAPRPVRQGHDLPLPDGRVLQFDSAGRLIGMRLGSGHHLGIQRHEETHPHAGLVAQVTSSGGHSLQFRYKTVQGRSMLVAVDTPLGRFRYHHEMPDPASGHAVPRLAAVERPDGMLRHYHYEPDLQAGNPYALTGISLAYPSRAERQRLATWEYDIFGRVIRLRQHGRSQPPVRLEYKRRATGRQAGMTRITPQGGIPVEVHFQRIAGELRVLRRQPAGSGIPATTADYDAAGRLRAVGGLELERNGRGELLRVTPLERGWPGLQLQRDPASGAYTWVSTATGATRLLTGPGRLPRQLSHANGDHLLLFHDAQGRPERLVHEGGHAGSSLSSTLQWRGRQLQRLVHPFETESRVHDAHGRLVERLVVRPALFSDPPLGFRDQFRHDAEGRLVWHGLPEGGALHYTWHGNGPRSRLAGLHWEDAEGKRHPVLDSDPGLPGYRHGNGLSLVSAALQGRHADTLALAGRTGIVWRQYRNYDGFGRVTRDIHAYPGLALYEQLDLHHDDHSRLQQVRQTGPEGGRLWWYAWHNDGRLAAAGPAPQGLKPAVTHDASGLPQQVNGRQLQYGPGRRLVAISDSVGPIAHYRHNAFGHRIAKHTPRNGSTTHFLYVGNRLVAEARREGAGAAVQVTRRYLYAGMVPVGMIAYDGDGRAELFAVHSDLSGLPRLLTDRRQAVRWLAGYTPTGRATQRAGDIFFPLRFPGQYEDEESGWHDNLLRTYAPELGHYLEPDPMGPFPGTDTYGYAAQQPWRHADPFGLLLFVFDGTRYSAGSQSNAWLLAQAYNDGAAHYHSGPGNSFYLDWDAVVAWRAGQILENQWQALLTSLERLPAGTHLPVDIIGFSRGAALARHFGNRIAAHMNQGVFTVDDPLRGRLSACLDLRFMGLFDTVTQFGIGGSHNHLYDFSVSEMWSWVSHAVALHEHRWTFPLTSADAGGAGNVVEAPFVGAHADIGGGLALRSAGESGASSDAPVGDESDLAKVALLWMHWQAQAASVNFNELREGDRRIESPLLRDMRSTFMRTVQRGDRAIEAPSGTLRLNYQDDDPRLGRLAREQTEAFISRPENWRSSGAETVGTVDMEGYARWLQDTLGWSP